MVKLASKEPLCGKVPLVHIYDSILKVKDVWNGMDWDLHKLYSTLPQSAAADVVSVKPMLVVSLPDLWIWEPCVSCTFSVSAIYKWLQGSCFIVGLAGIGFGSLNSLRTSNSLCGSFATKQYQPDLCLWPVVLFLMTLARFIRITRKLLSSIYSDVIMLMMFGGLVVDRPRGDDWIAWIKQASHRFGNMGLELNQEGEVLTDSLESRHLGKAGYGGLCTNHSGDFLVGIPDKYLDKTRRRTPNVTYPMKLGTLSAICLLILYNMSQSFAYTSEMGALSNIFMLMSFTLSIGIGIWIIQFDRNLREDNTCADVLAKTGPRLRICFISTLWECLSRL
ncbi:hypothetical protein D0Y65_049224 [Glycine soja]|uniref:Uncharacterized protein n=1 Tax=Glycine soja TaxID=3848 RepID=A0A445FWE5_GLYSO|nr:hypothetical protein D0Y65_049224 [Glycine soja]